MENKKLLLPLLVVVLLATFAGIARLLWIGQQLQGESPLALAAAPDGGFVLSTDRRLLEFDRDGRQLRSYPAAELGLQEPGAVQFAPDGTLWVFDRQQRRLFECADLRCSARSEAALDIDRNAVFALSPAQNLIAISDNNRHRLLLLDRQGRLLLDSRNNPPLHYPNQVVFDGDSLLIADSDRYVIKRIPFTAGPPPVLQTPQIEHFTQRRPYRFAHDDSGWRVLEAGETLTAGKLVFYAADGSRSVLRTTARDPVDFLARGDHLVVVSHADRRLLRIDLDTGRETALGSAELQTEWRALADREDRLRRERGWIPLAMMLLLVPLLLLALLMKQHTAREAVARRETQRDDTLANTLRAGTPVRLTPDADGLKALRQERNTVLGITLAGLVLVPGLCWVIAGAPSLLAFRSNELRSLVAVVLVATPLLLAGMAWGIVQYRRRLTRALHFTATGVELHEAGRVKAGAPYGEVRLEQTSLEIGRASLPLYLNALQRVGPFWPRAQLKALLEARQPAAASAARRVGGTLQLQVSAEASADLQRQRRMMRLLVGGGIVLIIALGIHFALGASSAFRTALMPLLAGMMCVYLGLLLFMERLYRRFLDTQLELGTDTLTVRSGTEAAVTVPYSQVWLGDNLLVAGSRAVRLAMRRNNLSAKVTELFPLDLLRDELAARLPAEHRHATDFALHMALLRQGQRYGVMTALRTGLLIALAVALILFQYYLKT